MEAKLIWSKIEKNENGFPVKKKQEVSVFVEEKEIVRTEFYDALRSGIAVKKVLKIRNEDYELSKHLNENQEPAYADEVSYEGISYKIVRAYSKGKSKTELVCGER